MGLIQKIGAFSYDLKPESNSVRVSQVEEEQHTIVFLNEVNPSCTVVICRKTRYISYKDVTMDLRRVLFETENKYIYQYHLRCKKRNEDKHTSIEIDKQSEF